MQVDTFGWMRDALRNGWRYDVVVLDSPKLVRNRAELEDGTRRHFDLNRLAMQVVRPDALFLSCSCAGLLSEEEFVRLLCAAARRQREHGERERPRAGTARGKCSFCSAPGPRPITR